MRSDDDTWDITTGVRQIVMLAAGLDSRAYRLDWADGTTVFELDQPQVLQFKREVMTAHGAVGRAERREVAVDLRDDWPKALRDSGFDPNQPSAWIAEGLLVYLSARAQEQVFGGMDSLACSGSHAALEEGRPMDSDAFRAKVAEAKAVDDEQHAPAEQWFAERGWIAEETSLLDYLQQVGRSVPGAGAEAMNMLSSISLVCAVKT